MPKTGRGIRRTATWYRHCQKEKDTVLSEVLSLGESVSHTEDSHSQVLDPNINLNLSGSSTTVSSNQHTTIFSQEPQSTSEATAVDEIDEDLDLNLLNSFNDFTNSFSSSNSSDTDFQDNADVSLCKVIPFTSHINNCKTDDEPDRTFNRLRSWAVNYQISHVALKDLLNILSESNANFQNIHKDPRSFLSTPRVTKIREVSPGHYCHIGIQATLEMLYKSSNLSPLDNEIIKIAVNIDGVPLAKSSSSQLYPILGENRSINSGNKMFLIGVYHGYAKPNNFNDFLTDFVTEASYLSTHGVKIFDKNYSFKILMFLMDAVAKSGILYMKGHSGYSSCTKCSQEGKYLKDRVCFPDLKFVKRTHADFIAQTDVDHHLGVTILLEIPGIDIIKDIPLDYMHLVALGIVKKLLCGTWCYGKLPHKLSSLQITNISDKLKSLVPYIPGEFARKPRSLIEVKRWKATEFRQFLFYTGPVALKTNISKEKYQHFLTLMVALSLLSSYSISETFIEYADSLLQYFVKTTKRLYGPEFLSHNFHNLLHLADDARRFGPLDNFNNFSSENYLQSLIKLVRKHHSPLSQIIRRITEIAQNKKNDMAAIPISQDYTLSQPHSEGLLTHDCKGPEYKMSWVVVKFLESNEIEVLPEKWILNGDTAVYPPYIGRAKVERAIKNQQEPEGSWNSYEIRLMTERKFDSFSVATSKATLACQMSDIDDITDQEKHVLPSKRKPKKKRLDSSSDTEESLENFPTTPINRTLGKTLTQDTESLQNTPSREKINTGIQENATAELKSSILSYLVKINKTLHDHEVQLTRIETSLEEYKRKIDDVIIMANGQPNAVGNIPDCPDVFASLPVGSPIEFDNAEAALLNEDSYMLLVKRLMNIGGNGFKDCIKRMLKRLMTDDTMATFSLSGHKGKRPFSTTRLYKALVEAIQHVDEKASLKDIESKISIYLSKANERLSNKAKKNNYNEETS